MKLGDVLRKEREKCGIAAAAMADQLGMDEDDYLAMEAGASDAEIWAPRMSQVAITLETPTTRLFAETGRAEDTSFGQAGKLIKAHRERVGVTEEDLAEALGVPLEVYRDIERGESPLEEIGPRLMRFAEVIEQPVFNLTYPCGLPFQELDDYP